jgi:hypothetical protein
MSYTKRQFVEQAFSEIGLSGYVFDLTPEQLQTAMRQMDSMMSVWNSRGIRLGYPIPASPQNSDLDQETGVPDVANEAIYLNLAVRIAGGFGKAVTMEVKANARASYEALLSIAAMPREQQFPETLPAGAGTKPWRRYDNPFVREPDEDPLQNEPNGQLTFLGE